MGIKVENLTVKIKNRVILNNLNFEIPTGTFSVFVGENGSGKTTTIKSILGLQQSKYTNVTLMGKNARDYRAREQVAYMPDDQEFLAISPRTWLIEQNAYYGISKTEVNKRIDVLAKKLNFPEKELNSKLNKLSAGLKKLILIINVFVSERELIIMDEPTEFLDPIMRNNFFKVAAEYQKRGTTFFVSTHNLDEIEKYANHLTVIKDAKIAFSGYWNNSTTSMRRRYELFYKTGDMNYFTKTISLTNEQRYRKLLKNNHINEKEFEMLMKDINARKEAKKTFVLVEENQDK
ncbi:MAG: ABC transporter ATP-binding protein [Mycoplasmataceae bacterium]|nr:ABC transporter ATP-binding protein [Mycoplasmataceae bacterium]